MDFDFSTETITPDNTNVLTIGGTGGLEVPTGTTLQRPSVGLVNGTIRYNTDLNQLDAYINNAWTFFNTGPTTITLVGDVTGGGTSPVTTTLATVNSNVGTFASVTVNGKGLVTAAAALSGDATTSGAVLTLATVNASPQTDQFRKVTVNGKGLVTASSAVSSADITTALGYTPVNKAGDTITGTITMSGATITGIPTPTNGTDAANKNYVDASVSGLSWKQAVRLATTVAGTLATSFANGQTVDGNVLVTGDRILIKNQATASENGIYVVSVTGAPVRSTDADSGVELVSATVYVDQGTINADTGWTQTTNAPITIGTTSIAWAQFSGSGSYSAGTGLTLTGNTFSLTTPVAPLLGGTGTATAPTSGQILVGTSGGVYAPATIGVTTGISLTSGSGTLTINNTGVTSAVGTANQVAVSAATGAVTFSTPATFIAPGSIASTSTITAATGLTVTAGGATITGSTIITSGLLSVTGGTINFSGASNLYLPNASVSAAGTTQGTATALTSTLHTVTTVAAGSGVVIPAATAGFTQTIVNRGANPLLVYPSSGGTIDGGTVNIPFTLPVGQSWTGYATAAGVWVTEKPAIAASTGVSVVASSGVLTITNTATTQSVLGTTNQITASTTAGVTTLSTPATFIAPGSIASTSTITAATGLTVTTGGALVTAGGVTVSTLTANSFLYSGTAGLLTTTAAPTNGQLLIGSTGAAPVPAALIGTSNITVTNAAGSITLSGPKLYAENSSSPTTPTAVGTNAVAIGSGATAPFATTVGIGNGSAPSAANYVAFANGKFVAAGDAQTQTVVLRNITTNATPATLFVDGASQLLTVPNNSAWTYTIQVVGRRTDATGGYAMYTFTGGIIKDATSASTVLPGSTKSTLFETNAPWNAAITADVTNGALTVTVTGEAAKTIRWVATVWLTQVSN